MDYDDGNGNPFASGEMNCLSDCSDFDISGCYTCGNGLLEGPEECDGSNFGGASCLSFGYIGGSLLCSGQCFINTVNCESGTKAGGVSGGGSSGGSSGGQTGFLPGANEPLTTKVVARGKSYPNADVHILVDGKVQGIVKANNLADFYFETTEVPVGVASFGFWSEDEDGLKSTLLSLTFRVVSGAVTTITGVYIAPTIDIDKKSVVRGESVKIYGTTVPDTEVYVHINSPKEFVEQTSAAQTGNWELNFNTDPLDEEFHTAKALFHMASGANVIKSGFSKSISFHVGKVGGEAACPEGDLNKDGRVNLTDFSIMLYNWGTDNPCADQNQNGVVDLIDFSIMMYYWTG
jgi:hypothetical protein